MKNENVPWPDDAGVALVFQLMLEQWAGPYVESGWHLCPSISSEEIARGVQDLSTLSWQGYAGRAGFYRLMDMTRSHGIPASGVFSGVAAQRYPDLARDFASSGNELVAHGWSQEERSYRLDDHAMVDNIRRTRDAIEQATGQRPAGWMSPMGQPGEATLALLAREGFAYSLDHADDDTPQVEEIDGRRIVTIASQFDVNDHQIYLRGLNPPSAYVDVFVHTLDVLLEEGRNGRSRAMSAVFNGNLFGHPMGAWALRECIRYAKGLPGVWITTHGACAAAVLGANAS